MNLDTSAMLMWGFPPPLWGRDREGGSGWIRSPAATPTPDPSPQGGGEPACMRGKLRRQYR